MGIFSKNEKKLMNEMGKKHIQICKEALKEIEELYADLSAAYEAIETVNGEFEKFTTEISTKADPEEIAKIQVFAKKISKVDKFARDAVRDVRDVLRNQKKRLKETQRQY